MSTDQNVSESLGLAESTAARALLTELFDETYDSVYRYCFARSGSHVVAEDVAAEVFADLARQVSQGQAAPTTVGWFITAARRRLIDHWRRVERHRRRLRQIEHAAAVQVHVAEPDDEKILLALQSLSMRQRSALTLRYLDDLSVHEVAIELGCRYQAAESLLARARRSFAAAYEEPS